MRITRLGVFGPVNAGTTLALNRDTSSCPVKRGDDKMSTKKKRRWMAGAVFPVAVVAAVVFAALAGAATQVAPVNTTRADRFGNGEGRSDADRW